MDEIVTERRSHYEIGMAHLHPGIHHADDHAGARRPLLPGIGRIDVYPTEVVVQMPLAGVNARLRIKIVFKRGKRLKRRQIRLVPTMRFLPGIATGFGFLGQGHHVAIVECADHGPILANDRQQFAGVLDRGGDEDIGTGLAGQLAPDLQTMVGGPLPGIGLFRQIHQQLGRFPTVHAQHRIFVLGMSG